VSETWAAFEPLGGTAFFERLVGAFYERVKADPVLLGLYPDPSDLAPAQWRLTWFFVQYWGGPVDYLEQRGHPRLRLRHAPFAIGPVERDHWLAAMAGAIDEVDPPAPVRTALWEYCTMAAEAMVNR
jgi:hemoglobin